MIVRNRDGLQYRAMGVLQDHIGGSCRIALLHDSSVHWIGHNIILSSVLVEIPNWCDNKARECQRPGALIGLQLQQRYQNSRQSFSSYVDGVFCHVQWVAYSLMMSVLQRRSPLRVRM